MITYTRDKFPLRNGQRLCSHREPVIEAQDWCQSLDLVDWAFPLIIGLGAGFHVEAFAKFFSQKKFYVFDIDTDLKSPKVTESLRIFTPRNLAIELDHFLLASPTDRVYQVLEFRPAWASAETEFQFMSHYILGRYIEELRFNQIIKAQNSLFGQMKNIPKDREISFGSLALVQGDPISEFQKQKMLIRSLVK